ncbi:MAG: GDP-mannose 4,6-dehydratase [Candidatus Eremiobacteraeota bacterium]|nr:GDP-mannose 4,6-dehydratase [Candidatus Eremiobacteraeota bacterium]
MRALVTGASGFVGRHLCAALVEAGWDVVAAGASHESEGYLPIDLRDEQTLRAALDIAQPDVVFHLAAIAAVPDALADPLGVYDVNVLGTARLAHAMRTYRDDGGNPLRIVFASSADVYGRREPHEYPLLETLAPQPENPYSASKAAAEAILLGEARSFGLDVTIARAFNHIGPGQSDRFAIASFAAQLAKIAEGGSPVMLVGNLEAKRDFLDVRDVVAAYVALATGGASGEIYNVSSGTAISMREMLGGLVAAARVPVEIREDPARMRPSDTPVSYGSSAKLHAATDWAPRFKLVRTLRETYEDARERGRIPPW